MAGCERDTYQIEPRTYVLFRLCLNGTMNGIPLKNFFCDLRNVLG